LVPYQCDPPGRIPPRNKVERGKGNRSPLLVSLGGHMRENSFSGTKRTKKIFR